MTPSPLPCLSRVPADSLPTLTQLSCGPNSGVALAVVTLGNLLWVVAYVLIIRKAMRDRTYGIPLVAIALNVTWELYYGLINPIPGAAFRIAAIVWLLLDVLIVYQLIRFGREEAWPPEIQRNFYSVVLGTMVLAFTGHVFFHQWISHVGVFTDEGSGISGILINVVMSILFVFMALNRSDGHGLSYGAAWTKFVGTALIGVGLVMEYSARSAGTWDFQFRRSGTTEWHDMTAQGLGTYPAGFIYWMAAVIFIFDALYVLYLHRRRAASAGATLRAAA
jgi:hypothetical protein